MKLVFIELDFWTNNEDLIEELIQTASGNHDVFRSLIEAEYWAETVEENVTFDCTAENLVDEYNELAVNEVQPTSIVIKFES